MQRMTLTMLVLGASAISAAAQPLSLESSLYPPNYSRASLGSPYLPAETQPEPRVAQHLPARVAQSSPARPAPQPVQYGQAGPAYVSPSPPVRQAQAPRHAVRSESRLGGGFIEFLFSGTERPQPQPVATQPQALPPQTAPSQVMPPSAAPGPIESIYGAPRTASLAPVRRIRPSPAMDTKFLPTVVDYAGPEKPGTVVINTPERFLYLVMEGGMAKRYGIGVGRPGFTWAGTHKVTAKREWPDWHPPSEMLKRQPDLPDFMPGGPDNPLGARALYLGSTLYRIHGSNEPWTIGRAVSSGCIRMRNQDVMDLYEHVGVGAKVVVI